MKKVEVKHLKEQDIYGENSLCFISDNIKSKVTDYAILKGAAISNNYLNDTSNKGYGMYWLDSIEELDCAKIIEINGKKNNEDISNRIIGIRPAFDYNEILPYISSTKEIIPNKFLQIEFGNYPKNVVCSALENELESLYNSGKLKKEEFSYTTDLRKYTEYYNSFSPCNDNVYSYKDRIYVRVNANSCYEEFELSNKKKYINNEREVIQSLQEIDDAGEIIDYCYNKKIKRFKTGNNFIDGLYNCFYNSLMRL